MKKQSSKAKRLNEVKRKHLKTVKRRQLSEIKKSIRKYQRLNEDEGQVASEEKALGTLFYPNPDQEDAKYSPYVYDRGAIINLIKDMGYSDYEEVASEFFNIFSPADKDELRILRNQEGNPELQPTDLTVDIYIKHIKNEFPKDMGRSQGIESPDIDPAGGHGLSSMEENLNQTPTSFESVNDVMRYLADNNVSIIEPYLIKSINGTLEDEEENRHLYDPLTPKRIGEIVEQIIKAESNR